MVKRMLRRLSSESTDFNFAVAKYATSRRMSCFGSADETISYLENEYQHGGSGRNRLKLALSEMVLKQFDKRRGDRKTDTAKVRFTFRYFPFWSKLCDQQIIWCSSKRYLFSLGFFVYQNDIVTKQNLTAR